jgi:hypothetical protein
VILAVQVELLAAAAGQVKAEAQILRLRHLHAKQQRAWDMRGSVRIWICYKKGQCVAPAAA